MGIFSLKRRLESPSQEMAYNQIREKLDSALTSVFSEEGKRTVLYYLEEEFSLTLHKASKNPAMLEESLTNLLGEIGWRVVKHRILQEFYGSNIETGTASVEGASLSEAFGLLRSFRFVASGTNVHF